MARTQSAADELPTEFAVFPLPGALLLPRGRLPLNIFEPRYLAMVEDSLAHGRMFGMIAPNEHAPRAENGASLYRIGCLGRLSHFSETEDGRFLITLTGISRFVVKRELPMQRGYRRVQADYAPFGHDLRTAPDVAPDTRAEILDALKIYFDMKGIDANWDAVHGMPDDLLIVTLAMLCPFDTAEKQALLEAPTEHDRAGDLLALLRMAAHEADSSARPS
jgi:Lon protease-like protein